MMLALSILLALLPLAGIARIAMIGTITSPATGSAHDHPNSAFGSKPPNRIAERDVQKSACLESAFMAPLPIPAPTRRFARANNGITTTETAATMIPGMLRSGVWCRINVEPDSYAMYDARERNTTQRSAASSAQA